MEKKYNDCIIKIEGLKIDPSQLSVQEFRGAKTSELSSTSTYEMRKKEEEEQKKKTLDWGILEEE